MKINTKNVKDERATFVQNVSCKIGYNFITFTLLLDIIYRGLVFHEAAWDLLGIIIISGFAMTIYQYKQKILDKKWIKTLALSSLVAFTVTLVVVFIINNFE